MKENICNKCGKLAKASKVLINKLIGFDDFGNDAGQRGTTMSRRGKAKLHSCMKCSNCGHSWIN